jgi:acyl-CoA synthetase (NDP forming)
MGSAADRLAQPEKKDLRQLLFAPRSVAVIGQSDDAGKAAGRPLKYLRQAGFAGRVYPVNARRQTVLGERAWPSVAALPEVPEHVYIVTPTEAAIAAVEDCGRRGVAVATVLADGFAEAGPEGQAREARLREICRSTGIRVLGPSSLGIADLRTRALLTANAALDDTDLPAGRIFAGSHSGSVIGALVSRGKARGIGFAGLVAVGNEVDLSLGEICAATLDDAGIDGYVLFLETLRNAGALRGFARAAAARGKPVVAYKLGRSEVARELAVSHTGALAGEDDVADAFLADCGIARVHTFEALLEGHALIARVPPAVRRDAPRVGVLTATAGGASLVVDELAARGVVIAPPSAATLTRLAAAGIDVRPARLIDLTIAGARYETMKPALDVIADAPEFDLVLVVAGSSARFYPGAYVRPILDSTAGGAGKPVAVYVVPEAPEALAALGAAGIAAFRTPEACADAIAAALRRRPPRLTATRVSPASGSARMLDESEAGALLDRLGIARVAAVALDADLLHAPVLPFAYPVAVKVLSPAIAHKTDAGGVVLGVRDGDGLLAAIRAIGAAVAKAQPGAAVERVLVQPMVEALGEALIGYRADRDAGPLVMVAAGGIFTEIYRDRSLRLAPVDLDTAREMIAEVRGLAPLTGFRGRPKGDLEALAGALAALSQLAHDPAVAEAEINPLLVRADGAIAVDVLVRLM